MIQHPCVRQIAKRYSALDNAIERGRVDIASALSSYSYVVKDNKLGMARLSSAIPTSANDGDMTIRFILTTLQEDRDGDIVVPMGCQLDEYALNPVIFFGHQQHPIPIATAKSLDGKLAVYPEENIITGDARFDKEDPDACFIYSKVKRGFLNATSIAFVPIQAIRREAEREKSVVDRGHQHSQPGAPAGWIFKTYSLTEWSIVGVPSNAGAIRDTLDSEKSFISPKLQKAMSPYAAKAIGRCFSGWCKSPSGACVPCEKSKEPPVKKSLCGCKDAKVGSACACKAKKKASVAKDETTSTVIPNIGTPGWENKLPFLRSPSDLQVLEHRCATELANWRSEVQAFHSINHSDGSRNLAARQRARARLEAAFNALKNAYLRLGKSHKKSLLESSGSAGGYTVAVENATDATATPGDIVCVQCTGNGNCPTCGGIGETGNMPCDACDGQGACSMCSGAGKTQKQLKGRTMPKPKIASKKSAKQPRRKAVVDDLDVADEVAEVDEADKGLDDSNEMPFTPKPSALEAAKAYQHLKDLADYYGPGGDGDLEKMDHPGMSEALKAFLEDDLPTAMEKIKSSILTHHKSGDDPELFMEKLCKALGGADEFETGEAGMVDNGKLPPEVEEDAFGDEETVDEVTPVTDDADGELLTEEETDGEITDDGEVKSEVGSEEWAEEEANEPEHKEEIIAEEGVADDPDTEEILERYKHPETGKMLDRKIGVARRAKNGKVYITLKDLTDRGSEDGAGKPMRNEGNSEELKAVDDDVDDETKSLDDEGNPAELKRRKSAKPRPVSPQVERAFSDLKRTLAQRMRINLNGNHR